MIEDHLAKRTTMKHPKSLSYTKALSFGVRSFFKHIGTFVLLWIFWLALAAMTCLGFVTYWSNIGRLSKLMLDQPALVPLYTLVIALASLLAVSLVALAMLYYNYQMLRFSMAIYEDKPLPWTQFFVIKKDIFVPFYWARFKRYLKISLWGLLFIVPGIYMALKYYFAGYSILDGTSITASQDTRYNAELSTGAMVQLAGFAVVTFFLTSISLIPAGLGVPIMYLASVHAYKQLTLYVKKEDPYKAHEKSVGVVDR